MPKGRRKEVKGWGGFFGCAPLRRRIVRWRLQCDRMFASAGGQGAEGTVVVVPLRFSSQPLKAPAGGESSELGLHADEVPLRRRDSPQDCYGR